MTKKKTRAGASEAAAAMRDAADAASVLMVRLPLLWMNAGSPSAARQREVRRMMTEKTAAVTQGAFDAGMEIWRLGMTAWLSPVSPESAARSVTRAAWAPARKTLRGNARRLKARKTL